MMDQHQVSRLRHRVALTRFANSVIHQNVEKDETETKIVYASGKKLAVLSYVGREPDMTTAKRMAENTKENLDFVSLATVEEAGIPAYRGSYSDPTARTSPEKRAELVKRTIELCRQRGLQAAGYLSTGAYETEISNSHGVKAKDRTSFAEFTVTAMGQGTGCAQGTGFDLDRVNIAELTTRAVETALQNTDPVRIEPGEHAVLLEPLAVQELMAFVSWLGFSGLMYDEERSCFSGMLGREVMSPLVTIYDEPLAALPVFGIDVEGVARRKTLLIQNGVLKNVVYDSYSAHKVHKTSTGNAVDLISSFGGFPAALTVVAGKTSHEDMMAAIDKGMLIKRFWYTRVVSWKEGILTGMTRDGTFKIEKGKQGPAVKNLRFQVRAPELLKRIKMVGDKLSLYEYGRFPHLLIDGFNITGTTG